MDRLVNGPAKAMVSSCRGPFGMSSREATPPKSMSVMLLMRTPYLIAVQECASSWASIAVKNMIAATVPKAYFVSQLASRSPNPSMSPSTELVPSEKTQTNRGSMMRNVT